MIGKQCVSYIRHYRVDNDRSFLSKGGHNSRPTRRTTPFKRRTCSINVHKLSLIDISIHILSDNRRAKLVDTFTTSGHQGTSIKD